MSARSKSVEELLGSHSALFQVRKAGFDSMNSKNTSFHARARVLISARHTDEMQKRTLWVVILNRRENGR